MENTTANLTPQAAAVMELLQEWSEAIRQRDMGALAACYLEDVRVFDLGTQLEGFPALRALWESCLPYFSGPIETHRRNIRVEAGQEVAVVSFYSRLTGMQTDHPSTRAWMRTTMCLRNTPDGWKIFHDHVSMPLDCGAEKPAYLFDDDLE